MKLKLITEKEVLRYKIYTFGKLPKIAYNNLVGLEIEKEIG